MKKVIIIIIIKITFYNSLLSSKGIGSTVIPVLLETCSVRSVALGKTFSSNSKNVSSIFETSTGLIKVDTPQISFFYNRSYADVGIGYLAFAYPFKNLTVGVGVVNLQTDTFEIIKISENPETQETSIERFYTRGLNEWIGIIATSINLTDWFVLGATGKFFSSTLIEKYTAEGFITDFSMRIIKKNITSGISINNIGNKLKYRNENFSGKEFDLPLITRFGCSYETKNEKYYHNFNFAIDYERRINEKIDFLHSGIEWNLPVNWVYPLDEFSFRLGLLTDFPEKLNYKFSAGVGIEWASLIIDYAFVPHTKLGTSHYFSITYKFPPPEEEIETEEEATIEEISEEE